MGPIVVLAAMIAVGREPQALGQANDASLQRSQNDLSDPQSPGKTESTTIRKEHARALLKAARDAYESAMHELRSGKVTDPEAVYRWSRRWLEAEQKTGDPAGAAQEHLQRMEALTGTLDDVLKAEDSEKREAKLRIGFYLGYYTREAKQLVEAAAKTDELASSPHDAAIEVARAYITALLQHNTDAARKLAAPQSLAASKELMKTFIDLARVESDERIRVESIEVSGRGDTTVNFAEVSVVHATRRTPMKARFAVDLKETNGRWLVTNLAAGNIAPGKAPSRSSLLSQSRQSLLSAPAPDTAPKATKVFALKHARAADLQQTISQLLELDNSDLRVAVDSRTNRVLVHGTREKMEEVEALIQQLDEPSAVKEVLPLPEERDVTSDRAATDPRPARDSLPSPADTKP
jgi:hypothetical protein